MSDNAFSLGTVIDDAKNVITNPVSFYREMSTVGGLAGPMIFVVVMGVISGVISAAIQSGVGIWAITAFPIGMLIGSFISGAILFGVWRLMGSEKDFEVAYRCVAYLAAISPIAALAGIFPYASTLVNVLWGSFLLYVASIQVHRLSESTSKIVFGVLALIFLLFGMNAERASRHFEANPNDYQKMSAEETGKALGEILKGLEKAKRETEMD